MTLNPSLLYADASGFFFSYLPRRESNMIVLFFVLYYVFIFDAFLFISVFVFIVLLFFVCILGVLGGGFLV